MSRLSFILAMALVSAGPLAVTSAHAQDARAGEAQATLSTRGVDFADRAQVKVIYDRIRSAARALCNSDSLTPSELKEDQACRARFVSDAVNQVNAPVLTAMNSPDSGKVSRAYAFGDQ